VPWAKSESRDLRAGLLPARRTKASDGVRGSCPDVVISLPVPPEPPGSGTLRIECSAPEDDAPHPPWVTFSGTLSGLPFYYETRLLYLQITEFTRNTGN
jgi:hypothetical protein